MGLSGCCRYLFTRSFQSSFFHRRPHHHHRPPPPHHHAPDICSPVIPIESSVIHSFDRHHVASSSSQIGPKISEYGGGNLGILRRKLRILSRNSPNLGEIFPNLLNENFRMFLIYQTNFPKFPNENFLIFKMKFLNLVTIF